MGKVKGKGKGVVDGLYGMDNDAAEKSRRGLKDTEAQESNQKDSVKNQHDHGEPMKRSYNLRERSKAATSEKGAATMTTNAAQTKIDGSKKKVQEQKGKEKEQELNKAKIQKEQELEDIPLWGKRGWYRGYRAQDLREKVSRTRDPW